MNDYRDRLEEWRDAAKRKARELDERYNITDRVEEGARTAQDAARRGAEKLGEAGERARREAERLADEVDVREHAGRAQETAQRAADEAKRQAEEAKRKVMDATRSARAVGSSVGDEAKRTAEEIKRHARGAASDVWRATETARGEARRSAQRAATSAGTVYEGARKSYERARRVYSGGVKTARVANAASAGAKRAVNWARENPGKAALVSLSIVSGAGLGLKFPALDSVLLGSHPHWLTHSALPVYAVRKAGEKFDEYLRAREDLIAQGDLEEAERERVEFERQIVRYVGAPLLGAFSCAAGACLFAQILQPGKITGAPISWLLGGNPILDGIWLFSNGVICFHQGYKFFMVALRDQQEAERIVREIKAFLPAAAATSV